MVFRDSPVKRAISLIAKPSRNRLRRITLNKATSITPESLNPLAGRVSVSTWGRFPCKYSMQVDQFSVQINTYDVDGFAWVGDCVGGDVDFARELALRPWSRARARAPGTAAGAFPAPLKPKADGICRDHGLLDRAQGCLLGQLAGDNLGALVEFLDADQIRATWASGPSELVDGGRWNIAAGQPTDDSELALMLARSIVAHDGYDENAAAKAYVHWFRSHPFDVGSTIGNALSAGDRAMVRRQDASLALKNAAHRKSTSESNGALMRIAPLAIFGHDLPPDELARLARMDAALTHMNRVCQDANALFSVTVAFAIRSGAPVHTVYRFARDWAGSNVCEPVAKVVDAAAELPPKASAPIGWVLVAVQNAFFQLLNSGSVQSGVVETVRAGGDTDTNAAISGALLGAVYGVNVLSPQWLDRVLACRPLKTELGTAHPRGREFWPVDCLHLAERLVTIGCARNVNRARNVVTRPV